MNEIPLLPHAERLHWTLVEDDDPFDVLDARRIDDWCLVYELARRRGCFLVRRVCVVGGRVLSVYETPPACERVASGWWRAVVDGRAL